jgi:hypothetical protein
MECWRAESTTYTSQPNLTPDTQRTKPHSCRMRCRPLHHAALGALPFARCSLSAYLRTGQCTSQAAHTTSAP